MKRIFLIAVAIPSLCFGENLFRNSTMDNTGAWQGDRRFEAVENNQVISVEAKKNKPAAFSQDIQTRNVKDLVIKLRYQTADYNGRGLQLRGTRDNQSSTFHTFRVVADGQWHELTWPFSEVRDSRRITFHFELLEGTGKVLFDDITVEAK